MKKRFLCIMLAVLMVLTGIHGPAITAEAEGAEATSNANIYINSTNFPDETFRNWIINNLNVSGSASGGYYLTQAQADAVTSLSLSYMGISNAKGIEKFTNLQYLYIYGNSLTSLDVTKNTKLRYLDIDYNQIKKLDLSNNPELTTLYVSGNKLGYLRLVKNTKLSGSLGSQSVSGQTGAVYNGTYLFDLTKLVPLSYMKYVTLTDSSHKLTTSTGKVTLSGQVSSFSYTFNTGNSNVGSISVTVGIEQYTSITKPKITTQPSSATVAKGATATFKVTATGTNRKYQWQYKTPSGSWTNCSSKTTGYNKATLQVVGTEARNGYQYRCIVRNLAGSVTSNPVTLTVKCKPKIVTQPSNYDAALNETAPFTVKAVGYSLKYQWQWRAGSSGTWKNCTSATTGYNKATLQVVATAARSGYQYRCRVKNSYGTVYTKAVTLTAGKPIIKSQPVSVTAVKGSTAEFNVTVRGGGLKFQWYYRSPSSSTWKPVSVSNASSYQMITSVLQVKATAALHGYKYRCVITNKYGKATSKTVTLLIKNGPVISTQPSAKTIYAGETASFTVKATGYSLKYQWQYKTPSGSWKNCTSATTGYNTRTLKVKGTTARNGYQYRCVISNSYGKVTSKAVKLTVKAVTVNYRALLVGEESFNPICYRNSADANNMKTMLGTVKGPEGTKYSCTVKIDLGYYELEDAIRTTFASTKSTDVSLFFIATHGASGSDGSLATMDYSVNFGTLANWLNQYVNGKVIVIIQSCGAGSAIYGNAAEAAEAEALFIDKAIEAFASVDEAAVSNTGEGSLRQSKFYVLAAAAHQEESWGYEYPDPEDSYNLFTHWLIEGIGSSGHMPADTNSNNYLTLNELYTYITQYNDYEIVDRYGEVHYQHVQVYPTGSSYKLFKR